MRLLNFETLQLEEFFDAQIPPYFILSHRWGEDEMTYQDMKSLPLAELRKKKSWPKLDGFIKASRSDNRKPRYGWVDTFCIDKTSTAELSEAINSMFRWYRNSQICIAFLNDVSLTDAAQLSPGVGFPVLTESIQEFRNSAWFTRGWTLQELLAPDEVFFYNRQWTKVAQKTSIHECLSWCTNIEPAFFSPGGYRYASAATKIMWASKRQTSRVEDLAYCLLGILDINMPLLYGEGDLAFTRLQEAVLLKQADYSLFMWTLRPFRSSTASDKETIGPFAPNPSHFNDTPSHDLLERKPQRSRFSDAASLELPPLLTNNGGVLLSMELVRLPKHLLPDSFSLIISKDQCYLVVLPCRLRDSPNLLVAFPVICVEEANDIKVLERPGIPGFPWPTTFESSHPSFLSGRPRRPTSYRVHFRHRPQAEFSTWYTQKIGPSWTSSLQFLLPEELAYSVRASIVRGDGSADYGKTKETCTTFFLLEGYRNAAPVRLSLERRDDEPLRWQLHFDKSSGDIRLSETGGFSNINGSAIRVNGKRYTIHVELTTVLNGKSCLCVIKRSRGTSWGEISKALRKMPQL